MIQIKLSEEGLRGFRDKLNAFASNLREEADDAFSAAGNVYVDKVKEHIGTHDPLSHPVVYGNLWNRLSIGWLDTKSYGGDIMEMWAQTGGIGNAVNVYEYVSMGVFAGIDGSKDPEPYAKAIHNEFGTLWNNNHVPSRPLFMPVANSMTEEFRSGSGVYRYFIDALKVAVRRTWGI